MSTNIKFTIPILNKLGFKKTSKYDYEIIYNEILILVYFDSIWNDINNGKGVFIFKGGESIDFDSVNKFIDIFFNLTSIKIDINNI